MDRTDKTDEEMIHEELEYCAHARSCEHDTRDLHA